MKQGFVKVAAVTPRIRVADPEYNAESICAALGEAYEEKARVIAFPELCITGYTCGDLFMQEILLREAQRALFQVAKATAGQDAIVMVGLPVEKDGRLYNVAAVLQNGRILGMVPKANIPSYSEFYEGRHFSEGEKQVTDFYLNGEKIPFGTNLLFACRELKELVIGCEICEDMWVANPPATNHALMGATVIVNLSATNQTVGKEEYRELLVKSASARLLCGYIYTSSGDGESTQDLVFGGHNLIAENGTILSESQHFLGETIYADVDVQRILAERRRMATFGSKPQEPYTIVPFTLAVEETKLSRKFYCMPFVPND